MAYTKKFTEEVNKRDMWNIVSQNYESSPAVKNYFKTAYIYAIINQLNEDFKKYKMSVYFSVGYQEKSVSVQSLKHKFPSLDIDITTPYGDMVEKIKQYLKDNNVLK